MNFSFSPSFGIQVRHLRHLYDDIPTELWCRQVAPFAFHPSWLVGHLTFSLQQIGGEIGIPDWLPETWSQSFATSTTPAHDPSNYPSPQELKRVFEASVDTIVLRLQAMSLDELQRPLPDEVYRRSLPTIEHALVHILVAHFSIHLSQLAMWRKLVGLPDRPEIFDSPKQGD